MKTMIDRGLSDNFISKEETAKLSIKKEKSSSHVKTVNSKVEQIFECCKGLFDGGRWLKQKKLLSCGTLRWFVNNLGDGVRIIPLDDFWTISMEFGSALVVSMLFITKYASWMMRTYVIPPVWNTRATVKLENLTYEIGSYLDQKSP